MLITVTWHDPTIRSKIVEVRDRPNKEEYFLNGIMNQAMRQAGYTEEVIRKQGYMGPVEFVFNEKPAEIRKVCATCGSTDIKVDAWAMWDEATQQWVLEDTYEHTYCCDCEGQCSIKDEEIKP